MPSRLCPICRIVPLTRREVKTCGSHDCISQWRSFSPQQKVKAMEGALDDSESFFGPERITRPIPAIPSKTAERDDEFLTKVFGPDAPGVSNLKDRPMIYGHPKDCDCETCESIRNQIK
jgi:hypothetical protein